MAKRQYLSTIDCQLLALVEAGQEMETLGAELLVALDKTDPLRGSWGTLERLSFQQALTRYHAAVQEVTRDGCA